MPGFGCRWIEVSWTIFHALLTFGRIKASRKFTNTGLFLLEHFFGWMDWASFQSSRRKLNLGAVRAHDKTLRTHGHGPVADVSVGSRLPTKRWFMPGYGVCSMESVRKRFGASFAMCAGNGRRPRIESFSLVSPQCSITRIRCGPLIGRHEHADGVIR